MRTKENGCPRDLEAENGQMDGRISQSDSDPMWEMSDDDESIVFNDDDGAEDEVCLMQLLIVLVSLVTD